MLAGWRTAFEAFLAAPGPWDFLGTWARDSACLPVYCDWTHAFGVTEGGDVVVFEFEPWPGVAGPPDGKLTDLRWVNIALHQGAQRYAWLKDLLPARPSDAQKCPVCNGTGQVPVPADLICYCGGAGWVPAGDSRANMDPSRAQ